MATPKRIAVVGVGLIGPRHAETVVASPNALLAAIVDPMPAGKALAARLDVPYYQSVTELLNSVDKPDGAIICTPNHIHVPVGLDLARAGVNILVEKPISIDIESGRELIRTAAEAGVRVLVGHHRRFNSYILAAKTTIVSGRLGDLIAVNGIWSTYKPLEYFDPPAEWRRTTTGGVILINMIHEIDLMHYLLGPITRVYAEPIPPKRGFEADEGAAITLKFESGAVGSFLLADNTPSPHNFEAGTGENPLIPKAGKDFYRIFGSNATLSVPDMSIWSYESDTTKSWHSRMSSEQIDVNAKTPFESQLEHFVAVIKGTEEPSCSGVDGLAALMVCNALKQSLETGEPVMVNRP
ncbi:oxidoreductase [Exophiala aquamarina CBS 119918]|uniref:Oxidoreductase n=1 Tax=Exophiala aquamarina CBS 119918 TaxID=1182545 RepID=A0A072NZD7_9EURO|nr:oxidoreductase [Exophiala aquamarina CBS 119918]KEF52383.1 oxidoreductase [Exophiala aquamarina CBS 119918]